MSFSPFKIKFKKDKNKSNSNSGISSNSSNSDSSSFQNKNFNQDFFNNKKMNMILIKTNLIQTQIQNIHQI